MARSQLMKPAGRPRTGVEVYHGESMQIDSTTTVMEACGSCHNLGGVHSHDRTNTQAGVGFNGPLVSGSASVTSDGHLSMSVNIGSGFVIGGQSLHIPNTGPHLSSASSRGVTLSGSSGSGTTSTQQDNTRVGN